MAKQTTKLTFVFVDPNTPESVQDLLKKILLEKLSAAQSNPETTSAYPDRERRSP